MIIYLPCSVGSGCIIAPDGCSGIPYLTLLNRVVIEGRGGSTGGQIQSQ